MNTALITGGSKGFGLALASELVKEGWSVVIDGRDRAVLDAAISSMPAESPGQVVRGIAGDVADPAHRAALVDAITEFGHLDLLVNNASTLGPSPLPRIAEYPVVELERVLAVNLVAPLALIQATLPLLRASHGTVVDITSDAAVEGYEGWGGYVSLPHLRAAGSVPPSYRERRHEHRSDVAARRLARPSGPAVVRSAGPPRGR